MKLVLILERRVGENVDLNESKNIHTVASLLKHYLAELPEPLLTFELMDCFMLAVGMLFGLVWKSGR